MCSLPRADGELVTIGEPVVGWSVGKPVGALKVRAGWSARAPSMACCQIGVQMVAPKISPP